MVMVVALAVRTFGFTGQVFAQHRCAGLECFKRVDHGFEFFVFHFHGFDAIGCAVAVFGNYYRDFLHLEVHFFIG